MPTIKTGLVGPSGHYRGLDPEQIIDVDVSSNNWVCKEPGGAYLYIVTGGDLVVKLIRDDAFHTLAVPSNFEFRAAVKEVSSSSTASGIFALL